MFIIDYLMYLYIKITKKRIDYDLYQKTSHWKRLKKKALKRSDYKCQFCSDRKNVLILHHNSYKNLFHERKSDVVILCMACHNTMHFYRWKPKKDRKTA